MMLECCETPTTNKLSDEWRGYIYADMASKSIPNNNNNNRCFDT
jgi:hypothetical protein